MLNGLQLKLIMKKKTKQLLVLVVILFLLLGGYILMGIVPEVDTELEEEETIAITEFTIDDIASYWYKNSDYEMGFDITEDGYVQQEDPAFPVSTSSVYSQLSTLGSLYASREITGMEKEEYGLDNPEITICVTLEDGTVRHFSIGDQALFETAYYLYDEENDKIYLVSSVQCSDFSKTWSSMVEKEEMVHPTTEQIVDVTVETDGETVTYVSYDETLESWQITTADGTVSADADAMLEKLEKYGSYSARTTLEYHCQDFAQYGLEPAKTKVTVRYTAAVEEEESTEEPEILELVLEFGEQDENETVYYTRVNGSSYVYGFTIYYAEGLFEFDVAELMAQQTEEESTETEE